MYEHITFADEERKTELLAGVGSISPDVARELLDANVIRYEYASTDEVYSSLKKYLERYYTDWSVTDQKVTLNKWQSSHAERNLVQMNEKMTIRGVDLKHVWYPPQSLPKLLTYQGDEHEQTNFPIDGTQYLVNVDAGWALREFEKNPNDRDLSLVVDQLRNYQAQSRFENIWKQTLGLIQMCVEQSYDTVGFRAIRSLLEPHSTVPCNEIRRSYGIRMEYFKDKDNVSSLIPLLIYGLGHLIIREVTEVLSPYEAMVNVLQMMEFAKFDYQDKMLKYKGLFIDWFSPASILDYNNTDHFLVFGYYAPGGVKTKRGLRSDLKSRQLQSYMKELHESELIPEVKALIEETIQLDRPLRVSRYIALRCMSNDGTYFGTPPYVALRDAIKSKINSLVIGWNYGMTVNVGDQVIDTLEPRFPPNSVFGEMWEVFNEYSPTIAMAVDKINLHDEFLNFLTSNSGGKTDLSLVQDLGPIPIEVSRKANVRVISAALLAPQLQDEQQFQALLEGAIGIGVRLQIRRRMRAIAVVNNAKAMVDFIVYVVLRELLKKMGYASLGKNKGNVADIKDALIASVMNDVLAMSIDIKGMDTSVLKSITKFVQQMVLSVMMKCKSTQPYGPYSKGRIEVRTRYKGEEQKKILDITAATRCLLFQFKRSSQQITWLAMGGKSHTIDDSDNKAAAMSNRFSEDLKEVVDDINKKAEETNDYHHAKESIKFLESLLGFEGTYGSGLPTTSAHHTVVLILALLSVMKKFKHVRSVGKKFLGDDQWAAFMGREEDTEELSRAWVDRLRSIGFVSVEERSNASSEYLQQRVDLGRFIPYPDRIGVLTTERPKLNRDIVESFGELKSIISDISNRVVLPENLRHVCQYLGRACFRRVVITVPNHIEVVKLVRDSFLSSFELRVLITPVTTEHHHEQVKAKLKKRMKIWNKKESTYLDTTVMGRKDLRAIDKLVNYPNPLDYSYTIIVNLPPLALSVGGVLSCPHDALISVDNTIVYPTDTWTHGGDGCLWRLLSASIHEEEFDVTEMNDIIFNDLVKRPYKLCSVNWLGDRRVLECIYLHSLLKPENLINARNVARSEITKEFINTLTTRLKNFRDVDMYNKSSRAYHQLRMDGVVLPSTIPIITRDESRIIETLNDRAPSESESYLLRQSFKMEAMKFKPIKVLETMANKPHLFLWKGYVSELPVCVDDYTKLLYRVGDMSPELWYGSLSCALYNALGYSTLVKTYSSTYTNILSGRTGLDRYNNQLVDWLLQNPNLPEDKYKLVFDAAGIRSNEERQRILDLVQRAKTYTYMPFKVIYDPRLMFWRDGTLSCNEGNLLTNEARDEITKVYTIIGEDSMLRAFYDIASYVFYTMYVSYAGLNKVYIKLHPVLCKVLMVDSPIR